MKLRFGQLSNSIQNKPRITSEDDKIITILKNGDL